MVEKPLFANRVCLFCGFNLVELHVISPRLLCLSNFKSSPQAHHQEEQYFRSRGTQPVFTIKQLTTIKKGNKQKAILIMLISSLIMENRLRYIAPMMLCSPSSGIISFLLYQKVKNLASACFAANSHYYIPVPSLYQLGAVFLQRFFYLVGLDTYSRINLSASFIIHSGHRFAYGVPYSMKCSTSYESYRIFLSGSSTSPPILYPA